VRFSGKQNVETNRAYVMVCNHQSLGDILVLGGTYFSFKWVSKKSVFKLPLIGWAGGVCEYIPIVRGDKTSAEQMIADCRKWLARGISVLIFPEGTRSVDGEIGPFKTGAFRVARESGAPVLPMVLDGTGEVLPKHGWVLRHRVNALVHVLPAIDVSAHATVEESATAVRDVMCGELVAMRAIRKR
jgi:1-acyl-sn-glycerol-3-phosphate acyltransferase